MFCSTLILPTTTLNIYLCGVIVCVNHFFNAFSVLQCWWWSVRMAADWKWFELTRRMHRKAEKDKEFDEDPKKYGKKRQVIGRWKRLYYNFHRMIWKIKESVKLFFDSIEKFLSLLIFLMQSNHCGFWFSLQCLLSVWKWWFFHAKNDQNIEHRA